MQVNGPKRTSRSTRFLKPFTFSRVNKSWSPSSAFDASADSYRIPVRELRRSCRPARSPDAPPRPAGRLGLVEAAPAGLHAIEQRDVLGVGNARGPAAAQPVDDTVGLDPPAEDR